MTIAERLIAMIKASSNLVTEATTIALINSKPDCDPSTYQPIAFFTDSQKRPSHHDLDGHDAAFLTPLCVAFMLHKLNIANALIAKNADMYYAAYLATNIGAVPMLKDILETPMKNGTLFATSALSLFLIPGTTFLDTLLHQAAFDQKDQPAIVRLLLDKGANVLSRSIIPYTFEATALILACAIEGKLPREKTIQTLINHNKTYAHINAQDILGQTAFHRIIYSKKPLNYDTDPQAVAMIERLALLFLSAGLDLTLICFGKKFNEFPIQPQCMLAAMSNPNSFQNTQYNNQGSSAVASVQTLPALNNTNASASNEQNNGANNDGEHVSKQSC